MYDNNSVNSAHTGRSSKLTQKQSKELSTHILSEVIEHIGKTALLFLKEGRKVSSFYVKVYEVNKRGLIIVKHRCYSPTGELRCLITHSLTVSDLLSGCQKLVFFDNMEVNIYEK